MIRRALRRVAVSPSSLPPPPSLIMNDTAALLAQLKIDRGNDTPPPARGWRWVLIGVLVVLLGIAGIAWLLHDPRVPVQVAVATPLGNGGAASLLDASGYVVARRRATVSAKLTGKLQELYIEEGQKISAGDIMARLDDSNARAELDEARARLAQAQAAFESEKPMHARIVTQAAEGLVSTAALDASRAEYRARETALKVAQSTLQSAERHLDDTVVRAPFGGVITEKAAQPGEIVSPMSAGGGFTRTGIGTLVDMDSLEIEVDVSESFINRVQRGQNASAKLNAYPDWDIPAEVIAVIPTADRSKATVKVRVGFKLKDPRILPDMGVRVSFLGDTSNDKPAASGVMVPSAAVLKGDSADSGAVYVISGETSERRAVKLGAAAGERLTVISGLRAGEQVALGELSRLQDGTRVRVVEPSTP